MSNAAAAAAEAATPVAVTAAVLATKAAIVAAAYNCGGGGGGGHLYVFRGLIVNFPILPLHLRAWFRYPTMSGGHDLFNPCGGTESLFPVILPAAAAPRTSWKSWEEEEEEASAVKTWKFLRRFPLHAGH